MVFLGKRVLKICGKSTGERPCRSVISIKLHSNFIEVTLRQGCSPVSVLNIFRTLFPKNTSGWLLLQKGSIYTQTVTFFVIVILNLKPNHTNVLTSRIGMNSKLLIFRKDGSLQYQNRLILQATLSLGNLY